jgi:hypothetical protein
LIENTTAIPKFKNLLPHSASLISLQKLGNEEIEQLLYLMIIYNITITRLS